MRINTFKYVNDIVILAENINDLQLLLNKISEFGQRAGLNINKTKLMVFSRLEHDSVFLHLDGRRIERVNSFKYLGCLITEDLDPDREVKCRIESARTTFNKMKSFFCDDNLSLKLRLRMIRCYVWPILLYEVEAWTLRVGTMNRLKAFETWVIRRMLQISWDLQL